MLIARQIAGSQNNNNNNNNPQNNINQWKVRPCLNERQMVQNCWERRKPLLARVP